jgi:uncharacterized protein (TIGR04141 family)
MLAASINKLTVYKLAPVILNATKIPGYKLVADGKWRFSRKDYSYRLFFHKDGPRPPGWLAVFNPLNLNVAKKDLPQTMTSGFILLLEVDAVVFGITGGVGHIHLRKTLTIEHRFGLDLAERILALPELRGLTQRDTSGVVNALDRAFRGIYDPQGDINNLKRVLTHVRGTLEKTNPLQATIGKSIQASDALTVNGSKKFEDIIRLLLEVNKLVARGKAKLKIPQLERIDKKTKVSLINQLEVALTKALLKYKAYDTHALFLDNEDLGYLPDHVLTYELRYQRKRYLVQSFVDVFETVRSLLSGLGSIREQLEALQRMSLEVTFDDGHTELQSLMYFICGDITYNNDVYFLNNRQWHRASEEYIDLMTRELDNIECIDARKLGLLEWNKTKYPEEKHFNADQRNFIVMDRRCIEVANEKGPIEFCDLLKVDKDRILLIHVKPETGAALRALFAQGFVSARLYSESDSFRRKIYDGDLQGSTGLTAKQLKSLKSLELRHRREMQIIFAIFDDTPSHVVPAAATLTSEILKGALTTFAKIDLLERVTSIRSMGYEVAICRIRPYSVKKKSSKAP